MKWYLGVLKKYATFNGRARRREYWMFVLMNILVSFGITLAAWFVGILAGVLLEGRGDAVMELGAVIGSLVSVVYSLAVLIPSLAVAVRRLHDAGRSGWWILFPVVNFILLCLDSQPNENRYGPNPKMAALPRNAAMAA